MTTAMSETFSSILRSVRGPERFAVGRRILSVVALGVLASELEPDTRRALRDSAQNDEMGAMRATLLGLAKTVEKKHLRLTSAFTEILVNDAVHSRSLTDTLTGAIRIITELGHGLERPAFGKWFSDQLDEVASVGPSTGEIATSRTMAHLLVSLARIEPGQTVYDPCCGLGGLLAYAWGSQPDLKLIGQEIHPISWALACLRLYLLGADADVTLVNSLTTPPPKADRIVCDPPSGPLPPMTVGIHEFIGLDTASTRRTYESAFLARCLAALPFDGRAAVLVTDSFLVRRGAEEGLRRFLVEEGVLEGIVGVSSKVAPWVSQDLAVIVLRGSPGPDRTVRMVDASRVAPGLRSRSRLDWSPMEAVIAAYTDGERLEGAITLSAVNVAGPGGFRPARHFATVVERQALPDLLRDAAIHDRRAQEIKSELDRLLLLLDLE